MPKLGRRNEDSLNNLIWNQDVVAGTAPFGTTASPNLRVKIVGGKPIYTVDSQHGIARSSELSFPSSPDSSRKRPQPKLAPLTEKPNQLDPTVFTDRKGLTYQSAQPDVHKSHLHSPDLQRSTPLNPHRKLPPISPSPQQAPPPFDLSQRPNPLTISPTPRNVPHRSPSPQQKALSTLEHSLPADGNLPTKPIVLKRQDELELRQRIYKDTRGFEPRKLKDIYLELTGFDRNLTGLINFYDLDFTLMKFQMNISARDLLLVGSLYLDEESGFVQYEKVLAFVGSSLNPDNAQQPPRIRNSNKDDQRRGYYNPPAQDQTGKQKRVPPPSPRSKRFPFGDGDNAKLLRLIEQQFLDAEEDIDLNNVWQTFRASDRDHRGKMSREQIQSLAVGCRVPLQISIINHIIDRCDNSNGQYDWSQFLEFIERVHPVKTGLGIPASKQPREYVKHYPQPTDDWPRNTGSPQQKHTNNQNGRPLPPSDYLSVSQRQRPEKNTTPPRQEPSHNNQRPEPISHRQDAESWFDRFMRFASSLYELDEHGLGYLPVDQVKWTLDRYNDAYMLDFDDKTIHAALTAYSTNGRVILDPFLKSLGNKGP